MSTSTQGEKPKRLLYACLDVESGQTFFASFIDRRGLQIELRSSWIASRGKSVILMPVPNDWNGTEFTPDEIRQSTESFEAHVSRAESRGQFQVRIFSCDQQDLLDQIQTGRRVDHLSLDTVRVGMIEVIKLSGRVSVESIGRIQNVLRTDPGEHRLVLLDVRELITIPTNCLGLLITLFKEQMENGLIFNFLVKPGSRVEDEIEASKILTLTTIHDAYDMAVAHLLQASID